MSQTGSIQGPSSATYGSIASSSRSSTIGIPDPHSVDRTYIYEAANGGLDKGRFTLELLEASNLRLRDLRSERDALAKAVPVDSKKVSELDAEIQAEMQVNSNIALQLQEFFGNWTSWEKLMSTIQEKFNTLAEKAGIGKA